MIGRLSEFISQNSTYRNLFIAFALYLIALAVYFMGGFSFSINTIDGFNKNGQDTNIPFVYSPETVYEMVMSTGLPDLQIFYDNNKLYRIIDGYGPDGVVIYKNIILADIFFPAIYAIFYSMLISVVFRKAFPEKTKLRYLNILPIVAAFTDYLENIGIWQVVSVYPARADSIGNIAGIVTLVKHVLLSLSVLAVITGLVINYARKRAVLADY